MVPTNEFIALVLESTVTTPAESVSVMPPKSSSSVGYVTAGGFEYVDETAL
jgi:hypothetical protein